MSGCGRAGFARERGFVDGMWLVVDAMVKIRKRRSLVLLGRMTIYENVVYFRVAIVDNFMGSTSFSATRDLLYHVVLT